MHNGSSTIGTAASIDWMLSSVATPTARINGVRVGSNMESDIAFSTYNGSALAEVMRVTNTGRVGIGTTAPGSPLQVVADSTNYTDAQVKIQEGSCGLHLGFTGSYGTIQTTCTTPLVLLEAGTQNVGVGTTSPSYKLDVNGTLRAYGITDSSDIRLKRDISPLASKEALDSILKLQGIHYYWRDAERYGGELQLGFVAQDVEPVIPEVVKTDDEGYKSIQYGKLTALLVEGIKEQHEQVMGLSKQMEEVQAKLQELELEVDPAGDLELNQWTEEGIVELIGSRLKELLASLTGTIQAGGEWMFGKIKTEQIRTDELCVEDVCVTRDQLKELLEQVTPTPIPSPTAVPTPELTLTPTPPAE